MTLNENEDKTIAVLWPKNEFTGALVQDVVVAELQNGDPSLTLTLTSTSEPVPQTEPEIPTIDNSTDGLDNVTTVPEPQKEYLLLGWDLDLTGRRLIDEMFHVAAYDTENETKFTQYIMPSMNLNPVARYRHAVTIVNVTRYRMLKDLRNRKVLRSRSEYSGLTMFLEWLENLLKTSACRKIIFMWHDSQKIAPLIFLKSLQRYNMLERFCDSVEGFLDTFDLIKSKCQDLKAFSLRALMKSVLNYPKEENDSLSSALFRAELTATLVQKLFSNDLTVLSKFVHPIQDKGQELEDMKELLDRQKSLKPIFLPFLRANHWTRQQANRLRKVLADNDFDFVTLQNQWQRNGTDGLKSLLRSKLENLGLSEKDLDVAVRILDSYFDPMKKALHYLSQELFADSAMNSGVKKVADADNNDLMGYVEDKVKEMIIVTDSAEVLLDDECTTLNMNNNNNNNNNDVMNGGNVITKEIGGGLLLQKASTMITVKEIVA